ncbi:MAG: phosphate acetyltransferase [Clostridia bacterium]|nr:phosphate acetyltransferase [Clostridia bacterium]
MFKITELINCAKKLNKTIVFPEAEISERVIKAVEIVLKKKIANVILLGDEEVILSKSKCLKGAIIINPKTSELISEFIEKLVEIRSNKGLTTEQARELLKNNFYFASMLVELGYADGYLGGSETSTANTLRPALQIIKTKNDIKLVSSCLIMVGTKKHNFGENNVIVTSDCALNISPNADELKDIVLSTVQSAKTFCSITPRVAMLSFSSFGSGGDNDESVLKVRKAIELVRAKDKTLLIDGEMQLDCALVPEVAKIKSKNSNVAGRANILIFPDLNSGNIGYKLMERFGHLQAVGVIMQGFKKPVNDLSRGCKVSDIVVMTAITCLQAQ